MANQNKSVTILAAGGNYPLKGISFKDVKGTEVSLGQYSGKLVVLNFWASWCPPCVEEMPELETIYPDLQKINIEMVGIGIDSPSNIREFLQNRSFSYPLLIAGAGGSELATRLGNSGSALPFTVILDAKGEIIFKKLGRITGEEILKLALDYHQKNKKS
jgi:peroxiredoxin